MLPMAVAWVVLWRRSDKLSTSGFMNDVVFAHKPKVARRRRPAEAQCTRSLELGYKLCAWPLQLTVAGQRTHGTKITCQVTTTGAESAIYDYLVVVMLKLHFDLLLYNK